MNSTLENSPGQIWVEYLSNDNERAQKIANIHAYRTLGNMNRDVFYDDATYKKLTQELGERGIFEDDGYDIYQEYFESMHKQTLRAASDAELPALLKDSLISREKELNIWIQENNYLYSQNYESIIQPMLTGKMEDITHDKVVSIVEKTPNLLPAMRMAYEISEITHKLVSIQK